jgi:hypothetical protein
MKRSLELIIDELATAACEVGIDADTLAERVRLAAMEQDIRESGETE